MRLLLLLALYLFAASAYGQDSLATPQLILDFPLADCPYHTYAARTAASPLIACPTCKANAKHNAQAFGNPSMRQSVAYTTNVMSAANFGLKKLSEVVVKGDRPMDKFWRIFMQAGTSMGVAGLLYTRPFGPAWTHEEFHRAAMTVNYIGSQDDVWYPSRWGSSSIAVSHVTDTNLIAFKANNVPGIVRMHCAGTEGEYELLKKLQENNFYYDLKLPNYGVSLISVLSGIGYVNMCSDPERADSSTLEMIEKEGADVEARDFTGWDFLGWIYDLSRPGEPYPARGVHPSGVGIDRYILTSDLTTEEFNYLDKMGKLQYLNLLNPMLFGINRIPVYKDNRGRQWYANAALRHYLTSFGHDLQTDLLLQTPTFGALLGVHQYRNLSHTFVGIDARLVGYPLTIKGKTLPVNARLMAWSQPQDHAFRTDKGQLGGLASLHVAWPAKRWLHPYLEAEAKTFGWVAGNPFLSSNLTARMGLQILL